MSHRSGDIKYETLKGFQVVLEVTRLLEKQRMSSVEDPIALLIFTCMWIDTL